VQERGRGGFPRKKREMDNKRAKRIYNQGTTIKVITMEVSSHIGRPGGCGRETIPAWRG